MSSDSSKSRPERRQTDQSLEAERQKSDREFSSRRAGLEEDGDAVLQHARDKADGVVRTAREKADARMHLDGTPRADRSALEAERGKEDVALATERRDADLELAAERLERQNLLAALLTLERERTDEHLLLERARADTQVASRDDFLSIVSHDLRTLLTGLTMQATVQLRAAGDDDRGQLIRRSAEKSQQLVGRMTRLVADLMDVSSIEAGKLGVSSKEGDAAVLVRESADVFAPLARAKDLSLEANVANESFVAAFDQTRLLQVLANLTGNAIKFTEPGGQIVLGLERAGDQLRFSVRDTGPGIAADKLDRIFERFWQVTPEDRRGLGLGLFIARSIVQAHGGRIWAESEPGKGSTFVFTVPVAPRAL